MSLRFPVRRVAIIGVFCVLAIFAVFEGCLNAAPNTTAPNVVITWNEIAAAVHTASHEYDTGWRSMAIIQVAVFEAVNAIDRRYEPYALTLNAPTGASADAAAIAAAHRVIATLYPGQNFVESRYQQSLAEIPNGQSKNDGIDVGEAAAAGIMALRANDGWFGSEPYTESPTPGIWRPFPPFYTPAYLTQLAVAEPWIMPDAGFFRAGPRESCERRG